MFKNPVCSIVRQSLSLQSNVAGWWLQSRRSVWGSPHKVHARNLRPNKHKSPLFSKLRGAKVLKINLPDHERIRLTSVRDLSPEELRAERKLMGLLPPTSYREKPMLISSTGDVIEPFVPPEGDGKASILSKEGVGDKWKYGLGKGKSLRAVRKIRKFDDDFSTKLFLDEAQDLYIRTHQALANKEEKKLTSLVTEKMFPEMIHNTQQKSISWQYIRALEPPSVVHVRAMEVLESNNFFAQVTVRFHSQQVLAVYDRFGRLIHGNPLVAKDVLEYVVFEKHLANIYGAWRLHHKIIPDWLAKQRPASLLTQILPDRKEDESPTTQEESIQEEADEEDSESAEDQSQGTIYDRFGNILKRGSK